MKKFIAVPMLMLSCIVLETVVFTRFNILGIRPDSVIAVATVVSIVSGAWAGTAYAVVAGLLLDLTTGKYLGLMSLVYMFPIMAAGVFYRRFYADNNLFACIVSGALFVCKELLIVAFLLIIRVPFNFLGTLWRYLLPSAILTAALTYPANALYRRLSSGQIRVHRYR